MVCAFPKNINNCDKMLYYMLTLLGIAHVHAAEIIYGQGKRHNLAEASIAMYKLDHPEFALSTGHDVSALFCHPSQSQIPILQLGMLEQVG